MDRIRKIVREILSEYYDVYPDFYDPQYNKGLSHYPYRTGIVREDSLEEAAVDFSQIPEDAVLVKSDGIIDGVSGYNLFLKGDDPYSIGKILGKVSLRDVGRGAAVVAIAAESGYGPLMYEIAMMGSSPKPVFPTRDADVREKAFNAWVKFYKEREDVKKTPIQPGESEFSEEFLDFLEEDSDEFKAMNSFYFKSPNSLYTNLIQKGEDYINNSKVSKKDIDERGNMYFAAKYD